MRSGRQFMLTAFLPFWVGILMLASCGSRTSESESNTPKAAADTSSSEDSEGRAFSNDELREFERGAAGFFNRDYELSGDDELESEDFDCGIGPRNASVSDAPDSEALILVCVFRDPETGEESDAVFTIFPEDISVYGVLINPLPMTE